MACTFCFAFPYLARLLETIKAAELVMRRTVRESRVTQLPNLELTWGLQEIGKTILNKDRKSTRLNSSHSGESRMPSSA